MNSVLLIITGLFLFLYALNTLLQVLQELSGNKFKTLLDRFANNLLKGILSGIIVTILLDSSSVVIIPDKNLLYGICEMERYANRLTVFRLPEGAQRKKFGFAAAGEITGKCPFAQPDAVSAIAQKQRVWESGRSRKADRAEAQGFGKALAQVKGAGHRGLLDYPFKGYKGKLSCEQ
jgi:hypothetical protein